MESPPRKLPPKKDVLDAFLGNGSARIFLDPRREGVIVPKWFANQAELVLRVGYTLNPPIPNLTVSDEAVSCTLSFNRSPVWCKMPWNAIFAVVSDVDGRGVVWPEDVPVESQLLKTSRAKPKLTSVSQKDGPKAARPGAPSSQRSLPRLGDTDVDGDSAADDAEARWRKAELGESSDAEAAAIPLSPRSEPPRSTRVDEVQAAAEKSEEPGAEDEAAAETPGKKPKRQLPPYLRVVK